MSVKKPKIANSFQNFLKERKIIEANNNGGGKFPAMNNNISEESAPEDDFEDAGRQVDENDDSEEFNLRSEST